MKPDLERHASRMRYEAAIPLHSRLRPHQVTLIIQFAAHDWGCLPIQILDSSNHQPVVVRARRQAVQEIHALKKFSSTAIGRFLGLNHSSVIYAISKSPAPKPPRAALDTFPDLSGEWAI